MIANLHVSTSDIFSASRVENSSLYEFDRISPLLLIRAAEMREVLPGSVSDQEAEASREAAEA